MSRDDPVGVLAETTPDAAAVLLAVPAFSVPGSKACHAFLSQEAEANILIVTYRQSANGRITEWRNRGGDEVPMVIITAKDTGDIAQSHSNISVVTERPGDLTGMGISITKHLSQWEGNGRPTFLCFDSLTTLLQYTDVRTLFRFLHVVTNRLRGIGAFGHFHIDPTAHDQQTVSQLVPLFDAVIRFDDDSGWAVET